MPKAIACFLCCTTLVILDAPPVRSGNLEMVEKNVDELESLNREAVSKVEGLPRNGTIDLKAYVIREGGKPGIVVDEARTVVRDAAGSVLKRPSVSSVDVSAPVTDGKIEFLQDNLPATKPAPGRK